MSERVHATTVAIGGKGVLIRGASGTGKSDLALRLIDRGAVLVSDDYTAVEAVSGVVLASPPPTIAGRIEARGIGIVTVPHMEQVIVTLVVELGGIVERMPEPRFTAVAGVPVSTIVLDAREASASIKVEIALSRLIEGSS